MKWINFLHLYQPADQKKEIFDAICTQSYIPLLTFLSQDKRAGKITLNVSGVLLDLFDSFNKPELMDMLRRAVELDNIELVSSAKYHCLLPLLPENEIDRQIMLNEETMRFYLGKNVKISGFFPPEMALNDTVLGIVKSRGYKWVIADELCYSANSPDFMYDSVCKDGKTGLPILLRNRRISNLIMSGITRSAESLLPVLNNQPKEYQYFVTGMDGETFGHHRPGLESLLFDVVSDSRFEVTGVSDFLSDWESRNPTKYTDFSVSSCTWASSREDVAEGCQYLSWQNKDNIIHSYQHRLVDLVLQRFYAFEKEFGVAASKNKSISGNVEKVTEVRQLLDQALASDHFWWASAKPWWSLEMIENGAFRFLKIIELIDGVKSELYAESLKLYFSIVSTAFEWQRNGTVTKLSSGSGHEAARIPFKTRTFDQGGHEKGVYEAFIAMMQKLEADSAAKGEYEQAILWRDAVYKLENKSDIYDAIHAVDLLRTKLPYDEVERTLDRYTAKYRQIRGGQPEQRD